MAEQALETSIAGRLQALEMPELTAQWCLGSPDYVRELGLTVEHVPLLLSVVERWTEVVRRGRPIAHEPLWAPVHAWRALGQLRAAEAVRPLLGMMEPLDELHDEWYLQDFPSLFAMLGPAAIPPLAEYLADAEKHVYPRACAAEGLAKTASRMPETRPAIVARLKDQLEKHESQDSTLNGFLVLHLTQLQAAESLAAIQRAYEDGLVDAGVAGSWQHVAEELAKEKVDAV